ncbi:MAG: class I SAM-dependent methyltransferase [Bacteroidota bacterium]
MNWLFRISSFLSFYFRAKTVHRVHSPLVFDFLQNTLDDDRFYYAFRQIEKQEINLRRNKSKIQHTDFGAGSLGSSNGKKERTIAEIARSAGSNAQKGQLLFRIANWWKPRSILEMGTSLGIGTAYLASALKDRPEKKIQVHSFEGCPNLSVSAQKLWKKLKLKNIQVHTGDFKDTLPPFLAKERANLIFFDGNHQKGPTLQYFEWCMENVTEDSLFIFDDIRWNKDMLECWTILAKDQRVTLSLDLYQMGVLLFKNTGRKQHFLLCPKHWKPWQMGFFAGKQS